MHYQLLSVSTIENDWVDRIKHDGVLEYWSMEYNSICTSNITLINWIKISSIVFMTLECTAEGLKYAAACL